MYFSRPILFSSTLMQGHYLGEYPSVGNLGARRRTADLRKHNQPPSPASTPVRDGKGPL